MSAVKNILLAKEDIDDGVIDLTVGEPHVVRDSLVSVVGASALTLGSQGPTFWEYNRPNGFQPLVHLLEKKHGSRVIVTNGAKQGLAAYFYACKKMGATTVGMKLPYWALIPPLAAASGCETTCVEPNDHNNYDSYLLLAPNNPDGRCDSTEGLVQLAERVKSQGKLFAHDAAYYTHSYLDPSVTLPKIGDVQIYSASKMLGLSSLRIGYVVCDNAEAYAHMCEYMEMFTVGVSSASQAVFMNVMKLFNQDPRLQAEFEARSREALRRAKSIIQGVNPNVLNVPDDVQNNPGMFGWFELKDPTALAKANIKALDGSLFGVPGYVRLNLAHDESVWNQVVERLRDL